MPATIRSPIRISRSFAITGRDHNRLGFSIQLCHLRFPGWPLRAGEAPAPQLLAYVARQLNVSPELFQDYARARDTTRREHLLELQRGFGFQTFTDALSNTLADHLLPNALRSPKPMPLITALLDQMRAERIIVPAFSTLENLAWEILARAECNDLRPTYIGPHSGPAPPVGSPRCCR